MPSAAPAAHPAHRIAAAGLVVRDKVNTLGRSGLSNSQILTVIRQEDPSVLLSQKDASNIVQKGRLVELGGKTPI